MGRLTILLALVAVITLGGARSAWSQRTDVDRVVADYRRALPALEGRFSSYQAEGRLSVATRVKERVVPIPSASQTLRYAGDGRHGKLVNITVGPPTVESSGYSETIFVNGPGRAFILVRSSEGGKYSIRSLARFDFGNQYIYNTRVNGLFHAPFAAMSDLNSAVLSLSAFHATGADRVVVDGRNLIKLEYEMRAEGDNKGYSGWYLLEPGRGWIMHAYSFTLPGRVKTIYSGSVVYGPDQTGHPPFPRMVVQVYQNGGASEEVTTFEFDKVDIATPPESDFTLAAYGLGDLERPIRRGGSSAAWWFLAAASCLIGFIISRRFARARAIAR